MPAAPAATPPVAKPANIGSAVPVSRGTIHVTAGGMSSNPGPIRDQVPAPAPDVSQPTSTSTPEPRPGSDESPKKSARESMEENLKKKAGMEPATEPDPTVAKPDDAPPAEGEEGTPTDTSTGKPADPTGKTKVNPWKLVDEHKTRAARLEAEVAELKKLVPNEVARKLELEEIEQVKTRAKELEDEIRYHNFAKSKEFQDKYEAPYKKAWSKAMHELKELNIEDPATGETRSVLPQDILELVNQPLGKARETANLLFGDFADDAMAHRKEIKTLFEAQAQALEEARTSGAEREKKMAEEHQTRVTQMRTKAAELWKKATESTFKDEKIGKLFVPVEGDEAGNTALTRGYELVEKSYKVNPMDPNLTDDQREEAIKLQVAVRNRAAAFGRLRYQAEKSAARIVELEAEIAKYKGSVPGTGPGAKPTAASPSGGNSHDNMVQRLSKLARPQ